MTIPPTDYWRLRALQGDVDRLRQEAQARVQQKLDAIAEILRVVGLDPLKNYVLDDEAHSATEQS